MAGVKENRVLHQNPAFNSINPGFDEISIIFKLRILFIIIELNS